MVLQPVGEQLGVGLAVVQKGDRVNDLSRALAGRGGGAAADHAHHLGGTREQVVDAAGAVGGEHGDRTGRGPAVPGLPAQPPVDGRPGQPGERGVQRGLVPLDHEQIVRPAAVQVGRMLPLSVQGVRSDQHLAQVGQDIQGCGERGDLVAGIDRPLGEHHAMPVVEHTE